MYNYMVDTVYMYIYKNLYMIMYNLYITIFNIYIYIHDTFIRSIYKSTNLALYV